MDFNWDIQSERFSVTNIHHVNADKLFVCLLMEMEKQSLDFRKSFYISDIPKLIPKGTAGIRLWIFYSKHARWTKEKRLFYF
jgi:hypothetical protein